MAMTVASPMPMASKFQAEGAASACHGAEKLRHLARDDDQAHAGQVAAHHRIRHVLDQASDADEAEHDL